MAPARAIFAYMVAGAFLIGGLANPLNAATWWIVWGTAIDIACLFALGLVTQREGIRSGDLTGTAKSRYWSDLK